MEVEAAPNLDPAQAIQAGLATAHLRILNDRDLFKSHRAPSEDLAQDSFLKDPAVVANEVAAQIVSVPALLFTARLLIIPTVFPP